MHNPGSWPLPAALTIDQTLLDLTEHAGFYINEDDFDTAFAVTPHLVLAWVSAAARYAAADYQLQLLHRPIEWMRDAVSPRFGFDADEVRGHVDNLRRLLGEHQRVSKTQADAYRAFTQACAPLRVEGLLNPDDRKWREIPLIAHSLTEPTTVRVPQDALAPWPLVTAGQGLLVQLSRPRAQPEPGIPVVRRVIAGFARLDHHGTWDRLLPDPSGRYWLRDFAWINPDQQADTEQQAGTDVAGQTAPA